MHRIDTENAATGTNGAPMGEFDSGDPVIPRLPTRIDKHWLNAVQEEIVNVVENVKGGGSLVKGTNTQLYESIVQQNPVRAFGLIQFSNPAGSAPTIVSGTGRNLASAALVAGTPSIVRLTFAVELGASVYTVNATDCMAGLGASGGNSLTPLYPTPYRTSSTTVDLKFFDKDGAEVDTATIAGRTFSVSVLCNLPNVA